MKQTLLNEFVMGEFFPSRGQGLTSLKSKAHLFLPPYSLMISRSLHEQFVGVGQELEHTMSENWNWDKKVEAGINAAQTTRDKCSSNHCFPHGADQKTSSIYGRLDYNVLPTHQKKATKNCQVS